MDHVKQSKGAGDVDACRSSDVARSRPNVVLENPQFDENPDSQVDCSVMGSVESHSIRSESDVDLLSSLTDSEMQKQLVDKVAHLSLTEKSSPEPRSKQLSLEMDKDSVLLTTFLRQLNESYTSDPVTSSTKLLQVVGDLCTAFQERMDNTGSCLQLIHCVIAVPGVLDAMYNFLNKYFSAFRVGKDIHLLQCIQMLLGLTAEFSSQSADFCRAIVSQGKLMVHIDELCMLRQAQGSAAANFLASINLSVVYCCLQSTNIEKYFLRPEMDCIPIFEPYANSSEFAIMIHAKMILGSLASLLDESLIEKLLCLRCCDMEKVLLALQESSCSTEHEVHFDNCSFSASELTLGLTQLQLDVSNRCAIVKKNIIPTLVALLCRGIEEQLSACKLLWSLLFDTAFKSQVLSSDVSLKDILESVESSTDPLLSQLAFCSSVCLTGIPEDDNSAFKYAEGCYKYKHYSECADICQKIIASASEPEKTSIMLLLGKANFHLYRKIQFQLQKQQVKHLQYSKEYQKRHRECYEKAKVVVWKIGTAFDGQVLESSDEEEKMLDLAMLDCMHETNDLGRCLLCRKKCKLLKSHYFPKCLLEAFCSAAPTPRDRKILLTGPEYTGHGKSPSQITYPMFCRECELVFNKYGESQFLPEFFSKIYNTADPSQSTAKQELPYSSWLHQFCVGIVFRGLAVCYQNLTSFTNEEAIYDLFSKCRKYLLNVQSCKEKCDYPKVSVLLSPTRAPPELEMVGAMNKVLNSLSFLLGMSPFNSKDFTRPPNLHFFVCHLGVINILAMIEPAEIEYLPQESIINPIGGIYSAPSENLRYNNIPPGLWKIFEMEAVIEQQRMLVVPKKVVSNYNAKKLVEPPASVQEAYHIVQSRLLDARALLTSVDPSPYPSQPKIINFLPKQFLLRPLHDPNAVHLPVGHHILLHKNFNLGNGVHETLFIAVRADSLDKPYVLYHRCETGLQLNAGFFVSPHDYNPGEFLPDNCPKELLEEMKWEHIENIKSLISDLLHTHVFSQKGIINYTALMKRIHLQSTFSCFDVKCDSDQHCWYCQNRCQVCLKPAVTSASGPSGIRLKFCNDSKCSTFLSEKEMSVNVWEPVVEQKTDTLLHTGKVAVSHAELLNAHIEGVLSSNQHCSVNLTLCLGDGTSDYPEDRIYCVYYMRTLYEQQCMEFFIGKDFNPEEPLPYARCREAEEAIARYRTTGEIRTLIFLAITSGGYLDLEMLLSAYVMKKKTV